MGPKALNITQWSRIAAQSSKFSAIPRRTFSTTPAWQKPGKKLPYTQSINSNPLGVVPVFEKTSSTELDDLLTIIRETIMMPAYLSQTQQDLVSKPKFRQMLINDEVIANIGGEKFRLKYIDTQHGRPRPKKALLDAVDLCNEKDMDIIPGLLEGIHKSQNKLVAKPWVFKRIISKLGKANREDVLVRCVQQVESTGLRLGNENCASLVTRAFLRKAKKSEDEHAVKKSLKWAEMTLDSLEDPKHNSGTKGVPDPCASPEVVAPVLELAALQAKRTGDAEDVRKVEQYAQRLLSIWQNAAEAPTDGGLGVANVWLCDSALVIYRAATTAAEALGSDSQTAKELNKRASTLKESATTAYKTVKGTEWEQAQTRVGVTLYEEIFGVEL
jgi:hypothetical protein